MERYPGRFHSFIHYVPPAEFMSLSAEEKVKLLRNAGLENKMDIIIEKLHKYVRTYIL